MSIYTNSSFYSFHNNKKEKLVIDYNNLYYNILENNAIKKFIASESENEKIVKPKKTVQWSQIMDIGETYSKSDYDRTIDSWQISQNLREYREMKQMERRNAMLHASRSMNPQYSMVNLFDFR
jgi:prolyl oligopeptidase PreP (S9A serine peptidase family)